MIQKTKQEMAALSVARAAAGRAGGLQTFGKYGSRYMSAIGRRGAKVFHNRYVLVPVFQDDYAVVNRETNLTVAFLSGMPLDVG